MYISEPGWHRLATTLSFSLLAPNIASAQDTYPPTQSVLVAAPAAQLPIASVRVSNFSVVEVCVPVTVLVSPTTNNQSTVTAGAEPAVLQALSASVSNGVLHLQSFGSFNQQYPNDSGLCVLDLLGERIQAKQPLSHPVRLYKKHATPPDRGLLAWLQVSVPSENLRGVVLNSAADVVVAQRL